MKRMLFRGSLPSLLMVTSMTIHAGEWKGPATWKSGPIPGSIIGLNSEGHIVRLVLADGREIRTSYSVTGAIERQRTSNGHTITYRYDHRGNLQSTSEDGRTQELIYDSDGELVARAAGTRLHFQSPASMRKRCRRHAF